MSFNLSKLLPRKFKFLISIRNCSTLDLNLTGRSFVKPLDFSELEMKSIFWTAFDLRALTAKNFQVTNLKGANLTLMMHQPNLTVQSAAANAATLLQANLTVIIDPSWDEHPYLTDMEKFLSVTSDLAIVQSRYQLKMEELAKASKIPIICAFSYKYVLVSALAHMMTLQAHYNRLKNLTVAWIGAPCPLVNTYLCIAPRLGLNIHYYCACKNQPMSPAVLPIAKKESHVTKTQVQECKSAIEALNGANVVVTTRNSDNKVKITLEDLKNADSNWTILHGFPRCEQMEATLHDDKNNLIWESFKNARWIYAALMLRTLSGHKHITNPPDFGSK